MKTLAEKIAVMQAAERGECIEYLSITGGRRLWADAPSSALRWNWADCDYRVKPKPREFWIVASSRLITSDPDCAHDWKVYGRNVIHVREVLDEKS